MVLTKFGLCRRVASLLQLPVALLLAMDDDDELLILLAMGAALYIRSLQRRRQRERYRSTYQGVPLDRIKKAYPSTKSTDTRRQVHQWMQSIDDSREPVKDGRVYPLQHRLDFLEHRGHLSSTYQNPQETLPHESK
jgi:hypothetical protein